MKRFLIFIFGLISGIFIGDIISNRLRDKKSNYVVRVNNTFTTRVIDVFDDFLDGKGIKIPNEDRDRDDPDNESNIYGDDFDYLSKMLEDEFVECGFIVDDTWDN